MTDLLSCDVLVVGSGVTGLATAWHLEREGGAEVALLAPEAPPSTLAAPGIVFGGQVDNYTRLTHGHGEELAARFWGIGDGAYDEVRTFCEREMGASGATFQEGGRLRLISSPGELQEAEKAVRQLQNAGFEAKLLKVGGEHSLPTGLESRILAVQDDGPRGAVVDVGALVRRLQQGVKAPRLSGRAAAVTREGARMKTILAGGGAVVSEMVVLAAHLGIGKLLPGLSEALVSVADQWSRYRANPSAMGEWNRVGKVYSVNHTYEWGAVTQSGGLVIGGGRYLRPLAGIEATEAVAEDKISPHLAAQTKKTFKWGGTLSAALETRAFLDCRPCDELPIIGPMFGESRILVATGYMGAGLTMGFWAGARLAQLIAKGAADDLPREFWPERLRSMES